MSGFLRRFLWPDWQRRKRMLRAEAWAVVIAAYALLAFAYLWPQDWRNESPSVVLAGWAAFMVRTLQFHLGLLLLLIAAVGTLRNRRLALAALPPLLVALGPTVLQYVPKRPAAAAGTAGSPSFRVMSANLLMINADTAGIIGEVRAARPDVLLLQEYTVGWHEAMRRELAADYPHVSYVTRDDSFGVAVYSRTPFLAPVEQRLPFGRAGVEQMRAEVDLGGRRIAVYNVHLLPPRTLDYYTDHRLQFADLMKVLAAEPLPYVVAGDFNFAETAPQHAELTRAGVGEAHAQAGAGRGATWPVNGVLRYLVPGIRIDHVYLGPGLAAASCETGVGRGSDHRPVVVDVVPARVPKP